MKSPRISLCAVGALLLVICNPLLAAELRQGAEARPLSTRTIAPPATGPVAWEVRGPRSCRKISVASAKRRHRR